MTQQQFRAVPTMLDISSLLTVQGGNSKASTLTASHPNQTASAEAPPSKASKKKKQQKIMDAASPSVVPSAGIPVAGSAAAVETVAQKENVPETTRSRPPPTAASGLLNGFKEKSPPTNKETPEGPAHPSTDAPADQEEEFPALIAKKPPPGFKGSFPLKASAPPPASSMPLPPPGLGVSATKPPPGFTGIPLNSNVVEPPPCAVNPPPKPSDSGYLVPEDFHQRNLELILSIRKYLHNDESKFNQFKNYSAQFRQGVITAARYHRSCKDLLGDDFNRIFNELLVLLPDTSKQQELLTAHGDYKALEKQAGATGGKKNKNRKNVWQTPSTPANAAAELDCQVCPTCRQVLAPKDFNSHKTLHIRESEDFPSLQSISRIIS